MLERRAAADERFRTVEELTTDSAGSFAASVIPRTNTVYRVRFPGDEQALSSEATVRVEVRAGVGLDLLPGGAALPGQSVVVLGRVQPAKEGSVTLTVRRGEEVVVERRVSLNSASRYQHILRLQEPGEYEVQVRHPGDEDNLEGSATRSLGIERSIQEQVRERVQDRIQSRPTPEIPANPFEGRRIPGLWR